MKTTTMALCVAILLGISMNVSGQMPTASEEHQILKKDAGTWEAKVTSFGGPAGPYDEPHISKGTEKNHMIGDFWLVSEFTADFEGMPFAGQATMGYDTAKKKYVGTWIDSFSPSATTMVGTFDSESKTMTFETMGVGMDGKPSKGKNVVVYESDDRHTMTMHMAMPGQDGLVKAMEIAYERVKDKK